MSTPFPRVKSALERDFGNAQVACEISISIERTLDNVTEQMDAMFDDEALRLESRNIFLRVLSSRAERFSHI